MWRRVISTQLQALARRGRLAPGLSGYVAVSGPITISRSLTSVSSSSHKGPCQPTPTLFSHQVASGSDTILSTGKKRVEDIMPIATGHEREELEGRNILEMNYPVGPFGTKETPAIVNSFYDKRIVGCPGGEGDEHHVVWFWLEKGRPHSCPVCSQYFMLEVSLSGEKNKGKNDRSFDRDLTDHRLIQQQSRVGTAAYPASIGLQRQASRSSNGEISLSREYYILSLSMGAGDPGAFGMMPLRLVVAAEGIQGLGEWKGAGVVEVRCRRRVGRRAQQTKES
ncbi:hypothetical protein F0562_012202 [Nyssa sinensis]|uniref:Uncharacterized protein n=1 Tax=Nyssa sinensis TaxID=561372 RepID=A0A5J4ZTX1_9ASTE|nr:hypothetical protein F0562_012202 [Nyssa sinensis]